MNSPGLKGKVIVFFEVLLKIMTNNSSVLALKYRLQVQRFEEVIIETIVNGISQKNIPFHWNKRCGQNNNVKLALALNIQVA